MGGSRRRGFGHGVKAGQGDGLVAEWSDHAATGDAESYKKTADQLRQIHFEVIDNLLATKGERQAALAENQRFINRYVALCEAVNVLGELSPRALDAIGGMGEQMAVRIVAAYLRQVGQPAEAIDATELIVTDNNFVSATPLFNLTVPKTEGRLRPLLQNGVLPIVTGFIGAAKKG